MTMKSIISVILFLYITSNLVESLRVAHVDDESEPNENGQNMTTGVTVKAAPAHIFFINLAQEKERCHCVSAQLRGAPYPITRIEAATPETLLDQCRELFPVGLGHQQSGEETTKKKGIPKGAKALYCSNYLTWKNFLLKTQAEYAIIMEDDIVLGKDIWKRVEGLLNAQCDNSWEYITIDGRATSVSKKKYKGLGVNAKCQGTGDGAKEQLSQINTRLTHLQIIRRSAIPALLNHARTHGPSVLDWWTDAFPTNEIKMSQWAPGIASQSSYLHSSADLQGCRKFRSTISFEKDNFTEHCPSY